MDIKKQTLAELLVQLQSPSEFPLSLVIQELGVRSEPLAVPVLVQMLLDPDLDDNLRTETAEALGEIGDISAFEALDSLLANSFASAITRASAAYAIKQLGDPRAIESFIRALSDSVDLIRWTAADSFDKGGDVRATNALKHALTDPCMHVRFYAACSLVRCGDPEGESILRDTIQADSVYAMHAQKAIETLVIYDIADLDSLLEKARHSDDIGVRTEAVLALAERGKISDPTIISPALWSSNSDHCFRAASYLAQCGYSQGIETLIDLLAYDDKYVRLRAIELSGQLKLHATLDALWRVRKNDTAKIKCKYLGQSAAEAIRLIKASDQKVSGHRKS